MRFNSLSAVAALLIAFLSVNASAEVVQDDRGVVFRFDTGTMTDKPETVFVAGSFNNWNNGAHPMSDPDGDGVWEAAVQNLPRGRIQYKFVINGDRWITDPSDDPDLRVGDNYGGFNSGAIVGPDIRKAPEPEEGEVNEDFVLHDPSSDLRPLIDGVVKPTVRTLAGDAEEVFFVLSRTRGGQDFAFPLPLSKTASEGGYDVWQSTVPVTSDGEQFNYTILVVDGDDRFRLPEGSTEIEGARPLPDPGATFQAAVPSLDVPEWTRDAIWYQVFPERFRNGDPSNDPGLFWYENLVPWNSDWWATLPGEAEGEENFYNGAGNVWKRRYGGDFQGLKEALPYLKELGINAIYLNPVFEAESMHKYDAADFRHIDDNFGVLWDGYDYDGTDARVQGMAAEGEPTAPYPPTFEGETDDPATWTWSPSDKVFLEFLDEAHEQGFKVILDGVFNHVGSAHYAVQDVQQNGRDSKYADWFDVTDWGDGTPGSVQIASWDGNGHLPVFKKNAEFGLSEPVRDHIFAITRRWMDPNGDGDPSDGIDGWRLDVPGDVPHVFWKDWRKLVKEINPDAYIVGEIWGDATAWLKGDEFDAQMNYPLMKAAMDFFIDEETAITAEEFAERIMELHEMYPRPMVYAQQNLLDSHDTDRVASMIANPDRPYDGANRLQDNAQHFDPPYEKRKPTAEEWKKLLQLVLFQHVMPGGPMTYYGNEAGMWSPDDPSNRQPMVWPNSGPFEGSDVAFDEVIAGEFKTAMHLRNHFECLRDGSLEVIPVGEHSVAVIRATDVEEIIVLFNVNAESDVVELDRHPDNLKVVVAKQAFDGKLSAAEKWLGVELGEVSFSEEAPDSNEAERFATTLPAHSALILKRIADGKDRLEEPAQ